MFLALLSVAGQARHHGPQPQSPQHGIGGNVLGWDDIVPAGSTAAPHAHGDTAVLMGAVTTGDERHPGGFRVTTVYQKRAQGWRMIAAHFAGAPAQD